MRPKPATTNASSTHCITSRLTRTRDLFAARWRRNHTCRNRMQSRSPSMRGRSVTEIGLWQLLREPRRPPR